MEQPTNTNKGIIADLFSQRIQLELLFSTGAVVSLANASSWLLIPTALMTERLGIGGYVFANFTFFFISAGVSALMIGFGLNILFRILTLCYLGIDYVFPGGVKQEKLGYNDYITPKINNSEDSSKWINRCERLSGFSFSISIVLVLKLVGLGILLCFIILLIKLTGLDPFTLENNKKYPNLTDYALLFSVFVILGVWDYIFLVLLRRFQWVSKIYYPIYFLFNILTLSFLYKHQKLILNTNLGRFTSGFILFTYLLIGVFTSYNNGKRLINISDQRKFTDVSISNKYFFTKNGYEDSRDENEPVKRLIIPSATVEGNFIPLFCNYAAVYDVDIQEIYQTQTIDQDSVVLLGIETEKRLAAISQFFQVSIDDSLCTNQKWFFHRYPKTDQKGFLTYLSIGHLKNGLHQINVKLKISEKDQYIDSKNDNSAYINFVKDVK